MIDISGALTQIMNTYKCSPFQAFRLLKEAKYEPVPISIKQSVLSEEYNVNRTTDKLGTRY